MLTAQGFTGLVERQEIVASTIEARAVIVRAPSRLPLPSVPPADELRGEGPVDLWPRAQAEMLDQFTGEDLEQLAFAVARTQALVELRNQAVVFVLWRHEVGVVDCEDADGIPAE
jgi:hypothetical protein